MSELEYDDFENINLDAEHEKKVEQEKPAWTTDQLERYISIQLSLQSTQLQKEPKLIKIDSDFYERVQEYLSRQKPTARFMIKLENFIHFRIERIISHCLSRSSDVESLLSTDEKEFYNQLCFTKEEFEYGIFRKIKERAV